VPCPGELEGSRSNNHEIVPERRQIEAIGEDHGSGERAIVAAAMASWLVAVPTAPTARFVRSR
jgi:hypothetical protein